MSDNYVTIGDLEQVTALDDNYKLLIDESNGGDTKSAEVKVLKDYLTDTITPNVNKDTNTWFVGDTDTGVKAGVGIDIWESNLTYVVNDFVCFEDMIYRCITSPQANSNVFDKDEWSSMASKITYATNEDITTMINSIWEVNKNE